MWKIGFKLTKFDEEKYIAPTTEQSHKLTTNLALMINDQIFAGKVTKPDIIIAIGKGALTWVKELADWLNISQLSSFQIVHYREMSRRLKEPVILQSLPIQIEGKTILLFDDVVETGKTFQLGANYLKMRGAEKIMTAVLFYKRCSKFKPDFFVAETKAWIIFHDETLETVKFLGSKWLKQGLSFKEIRERLLKIGLEKKGIDYAMRIIFNFPSSELRP